jgi:putative transposase
MTASAKGTVENPGTNVAQKAGLNRAIVDGDDPALRQIQGGLARRRVRRGARGRYLAVLLGVRQAPKDDEPTRHLEHGRLGRDRFECPLCGYSAHADVNAARNILALGRQHWAAEDCTDGRSVPACRGLRPKRAREAGMKDRGRPHAN